MYKYEHSVVACARWEEQDIQEWIEYYRSIGADHVYLYSNDDDPLSLLRHVLPYVEGPAPFVTYKHYPYVGRQLEIYLHFIENFSQESKWFGFFDVDEFLTLPNLDDIGLFLARLEQSVNCIYFHQLNYGNSGKQVREPGSVLSTYTRREPHITHNTKYLVRSELFSTVDFRTIWRNNPSSFHHVLDQYSLPGLNVTDVMGRSMLGYGEDFPERAREWIHRPGYSDDILSAAYLSHFMIKSEADFLRRASRNASGIFSGQRSFAQQYNSGEFRRVLDRMNEIFDPYLKVYWDRRVANSCSYDLFMPLAGLRNVALGKPATQSSTYCGHTANFGNNGVKTGGIGFHTWADELPWWRVDLLEIHSISEIVLYNRIDRQEMADRVQILSLLISDDDNQWSNVRTFDFRGSQVFGGADGFPLRLTLKTPLRARFVMLRLEHKEFFHLDEVEIYGNSCFV